VTPPSTRAVKRWQRSGASMRTRTSVVTGAPDSFGAGFGGVRRAPVRAASSRATPRTERQSGRFGVTSTSRTWSSRPRRVMRSCPSRASASRRRIPASCSSPSPSSRSEQSIPCDSTPRIFVAVMRRPPGSTAPGGANAARAPTLVLGAPQITEKRSRPVDTRQRSRRWPWLSPSSRSIASISPTTTPARPAGASGMTLATSMPALTSRSAASAALSARSANSVTQRYGIFMLAKTARPHANCLRKRRSLSKKRRRSSMPYLSIAIRSIPIPNAQPVTSSGS